MEIFVCLCKRKLEKNFDIKSHRQRGQFSKSRFIPFRLITKNCSHYAKPMSLNLLLPIKKIAISFSVLTLFESVDRGNHFLFSVSNVYLHFSKIDLSHSSSGKRIRSFKMHKLHTQTVHFHLYLRQRDRLERKMFPSETFVFNTEHS